MVKIGGKLLVCMEEGRRQPVADGSDCSLEEQSWRSESRCSGASSHEIDIESGTPVLNARVSQEVELVSGVVDGEANVDKVERDCRICHLGLVSGGDKETGIPMELGCACKDDLAAVHKHCAEAWFKIKGDKTCEICGSVAKNVVTVVETEVTEQSNEVTSATGAQATPSETLRFWQGHRLLNLLLACMVFAFVISWLFRFNVQA